MCITNFKIMKELENKVAIITGAGSGIGKSTALLFARNGAKLVLTDINEDHLLQVVGEVKSLGAEAVGVTADSSRAEDNKEIVDIALDVYGRLDIAVNNAGIGGAMAPVGEYDIQEWLKVININLNGVFYGMHYQIPAIEKTSGKGSVINVASILGSVGFANSSAYVAAKHGVVGLTKTASLEYSSKGIRVNSVGPGFIKTPLVQSSLPQEALDGLVALHPIGRLGEPEEVAEVFLFLASERSSFVTGSYYTVDGGYTSV